MNQYVLQHIKYYPIFACHRDKSPATLHGFMDATQEEAGINYQFNNDEGFLIGLPTGNVSGIIVIDFDINKPMEDARGKKLDPIVIDPRSVDELKTELEEKFGELPETFEVETKNGGRHLYYKLPEEGTTLSSGRRVFDKTLPVDLRANGGYVCTVDGIGYTVYDDVEGLELENLFERIALAPDWILNWKKENRSSSNQASLFDGTTEVQKNEIRFTLPESEILEIRSALAYVSSDDRDLWVQIGMILKNSGDEDQCKGLWIEWSQKSDKFDPKDAESKWASFKPRGDVGIGTIIKIAQDRGFVTTYKSKDASPVQATITIEEIKSLMSEEPQVVLPFPKDLLRPEGFIGEVVDYMESVAIKSQPQLALGGAIALTGMLLGRKVQSSTGIRTNIYIISLGDSGCGKDNPRAMIKKIFQTYDENTMHKYCGVQDVTSDTAIFNSLSESPSQIFLIDEMGRFLNNIVSKNAQPQLIAVSRALLTMYSEAHQVSFGKTFADSKNNVKINNPNLCIYGTATPQQFYDSITKEAITDGLISRMLIFESENSNPPIIEAEPRDVPESIMQKVKLMMGMPTNAYPRGNLDTVTCVRPRVVVKNENAKKMHREYIHEMQAYKLKLKKDGRQDVIYNRIELTAEKLAMIYAVSHQIGSTDNFTIEEMHMDYGIRMTNYLYDKMLYAVENFVWENECERQSVRLLSKIKERNGIFHQDLVRSSQHLDVRRRNDALLNLIEGGYVSENFTADPKGGNKLIKFYTPLY